LFDAVAERDRWRGEYIRRAIERGKCRAAERHGAAVGYGVLTYAFYGNGMIEIVYVAEEHRCSGGEDGAGPSLTPGGHTATP